MATTHGSEVGLTINVDPPKRMLAAILRELTVREMLETIGDRQLEWVGRNLESAGRAGGKPWQRMADSTIKARPQRPSSSHFSSRYQSLLQQSFVRVVHEAEDAVSVGTNAMYAAYHHFGAQRGAWRLPAREMLPGADDALHLAMEVVQTIAQNINRAA